MAINDNTSYELFGYQVKDLANKIKSKAEASSLAPVATSGLYSDLTGAPTIPTVYNGTLTVTQNGTTAGTFTANSSTDATIALTDTTYSAFTGTDGQTAGTAGLVPAPATTDAGKFLKADGTWDTAGGSWAGSKVYYGTISGYRTQLKTVTVQNDFTPAVGNILVLYASGQNIYESSTGTAFRMRVNGANTTDWVYPSTTGNGKYDAGEILIMTCYSVGANGGSWFLESHIANTDFYGEVKIGSGYTSNDATTVPTNAQLYSVYTLANGKKGAVTYYATSDNTQGFPTYYTYLYSDSARTTVVTPDIILNNFENGNTVLIEYESTGTGSSAYKMTLTVTTMTLDGDNAYRMTVIELNEYNTTYNCVTACLSTAWDGQSSFNGRWGIARNTRPVVNDGTLTIQQNGTTVDTFTANSSADKTVNIETITAETVAPAEEVGAITSSMIDWSTMPGSYSTTEQKTPFTWIDGKPIYKKSVDFGWLPNNTTKHVNHGISNFGRLVKVEGSAGVNGNWTMMPLVFQGDQSNYNTEFQVTSTYIHMSANTDRSSWRDCVVTLWYTKTTD